MKCFSTDMASSSLTTGRFPIATWVRVVDSAGKKKKEKGWEGWVKSNVTGRSGAYGRCNTGQLYALVRRQAAARRQDPTVTAMRRRSQLGVKELESELPAYCSEAVGLYFFICTSHEVVMCDKKHTPPNLCPLA